MGFGKEWMGVNGYMIKDPGTFFTEYDETHGIGYPVAFMLASFLAVMAPFALLSFVLNISTPSDAVLAVAAFFGFGVVAWFATLVEALLAHGIVYLFGARGLSKTLEAYAFPTAVRNALWWFPLVNLALGLYGFYLQVKGLAAFHGISTGKAAVAGILAAIFYLIPVAVVLAAVIGAFVLDMGQEPGTAVEQTAFLLEIAA